MPDGDKKEWWVEAMKKKFGEDNDGGFSMSREDIRTLGKILKVCFDDMKKGMAAHASKTPEITELERTHLKDLVLASIQVFNDTCPAEAKPKYMEEYMKILGGDTEL